MIKKFKYKFGINASCYGDRPSGAKNRFIGLFNIIFGLMSNTQFIIYESKDHSLKKYFKKRSNIVFIKTSIPSEGRIEKLFKSFFFWRNINKNESFDIFEFLNLPLFKINNSINLLTIHDLRWLYFEKNYFKLLLYKLVFQHSLNNSYKLIAVSNTIKNEISKFIPKKKISVFYNGISKQKKIKYKFYKKYFKKYILSIGHLEKRKNFLNLIYAYNKIKNKIDQKLIIIGNDLGEKINIEKKLKELNLSKDVKLISGVSNEEVNFLYKNSSLLVFPSKYEGFGIPILEAMKFRIPMAISNIKIFKEITSNRGFYFDPYDINQISKCIIEALKNKKKKNKLQNYYDKRLANFNLEKIAGELCKFYYYCLKNK
tara:strand:+ start:751 stop:1863 length:1113 start_codon:yes stop_codon:yes gene_type:complete